jgi:thiosulfate/3-mercaptopyruvate sulfurtransferase
MVRVFALATAVALSVSGAATASAQTPGPIVSTTWLQQHLNDPHVHVISTGDQKIFDAGHIPGARFVEHMDTLEGGHLMAAPAKLAALFAKAGAADGDHVVLYGESPMTTGWIYMGLASIGHANDVSWLDGNIDLWKSEQRPVETKTAPAASGHLTVKPAPDIIVDRSFVRGHLQDPAIKVLDVRSQQEWDGGHLPGATLVLWQNLFADRKTLKFKSTDELRALFTSAGVQPKRQVVTYCAVGMRASLMYFAARTAGLPVRVYLGSYQDWQMDSTDPIVR